MEKKNKKLTVGFLQETDSFAGAPVEKEIVWIQGEKEIKATTYIRKLSYRSAVADLFSSARGTDNVAGRIAACICDENGKAVFEVGDITGESDPKRGPMDHNLTIALLNAIAEVNFLGKQKA